MKIEYEDPFVKIAGLLGGEEYIRVARALLNSENATDEEIANVLSLPVKTVEKYINNVPMRINQEETVSSLGLSSDYKAPDRTSPNKSEAEEDKVAPPSQAPKPTVTPTPIMTQPKAPKSTDTPIRTLLAILVLVLSPLLLIFHSHAMRTRTRTK